MPAQVRVFAPGSIGNLGPGLDVLGLAVDGAGDIVSAERSEPGVVIEEPGHPALSRDPARHSSGIAALAVLRMAGADFGARLRVEKGLPLAGGQGGSAGARAGSAIRSSIARPSRPRSPLAAAATIAPTWAA